MASHLNPQPQGCDVVQSTPDATGQLHDQGRSKPSATLYLIFIQITSRALTFMGNQILLRYISPSLFGLAVQLEVLSITILYTARESLRVALQRHPLHPSVDSVSVSRSKSAASISSQKVVNLSYLSLVFGLCISSAFCYAYLRNVNEEVSQTTHFILAFRTYTAATCIELMSEPFFLIVQQKMLYKARARAETLAAIVRCVSACLTASMMHTQRGTVTVLPFAIGQLSYALTLVLTFILASAPIAWSEGFSVIPKPIRSNSESANLMFSLFSKPLLSLTLTFYAQSLLKFLLTQGDSLILSFLADLHAQGGFALASNYGGLASRLLLQPIEESSRGVFGRLMVQESIAGKNSPAPTISGKAAEGVNYTMKPTTHEPINATNSEGSNSNTRGETFAGVNQSSSGANPVNSALTHLTTVMHGYLLLVAIPCCTIMPYVLPVAIQNLIGKRWSTPDTFALLSLYSYYIPFLAINGILDAFVTSVATPKQLRTQSVLMLIVTTIYAVLAWLFLSYLGHGAAGLVEANIANMALRITYSILFLWNWIQHAVPQDEKKHVRKIFIASLPTLSSTLAALTVIVYLHMFIPGTRSDRMFMGIQGFDVHDLGYLTSAAIILGSTM